MGPSSRFIVLFLVGAASLAGCSGTLGGSSAGPVGEGADLASRTYDLALGPEGPPQDLNCGGQAFAITRIPPNVLFVLDRSGSMSDSITISNPNGTAKWSALQGAMREIVANYDTMMQLGAMLFPATSGGACTPGTINVQVGVQHGQSILGLLNQTTPGGETPTAQTLDVAIAQGRLSDPTRDNILVLATDGVPNCNDTDVATRISRLYARVPSVSTYVIGVGDGPGAADPVALTAWAQAGHTARTGPIAYYQATSAKDLSDAFATILGNVVSCSFALAKAPPDPMQLYVWMDGKMLLVDPNGGWTYDAQAMSITLHGAACNRLKTVPTTKVQVVYGCPAPPAVM